MSNFRHSEAALLKRPIRPGVAALIGLIAAAICLLLFASDVSLILEIDIGGLVISFVLCGVGAGIGFTLLYRAIPRRPPETLFGRSRGVMIEPGTEIRAESQERAPAAATSAIASGIKQPSKTKSKHLFA
jgi:hypothetical protein